MTGPRHTKVGTAAIELGNLNAMSVIGTQGDRDQVETLNHRRESTAQPQAGLTAGECSGGGSGSGSAKDV